MTNKLPSPPVLKTTIIQLNRELDLDDGNYEILTNEYSGTLGSLEGAAPDAGLEQGTTKHQKRKRRRLSSNVDSEELLERKNATKQLHSIIEKKRRLKINREFEALKYLIPACRASSGISKKQSNNSGNKIDGMYKLSILKASVEYILYLHHIIQRQHEIISSKSYDENSFNINFARVALDVNTYRNINKPFDFQALSAETQAQEGTHHDATTNDTKDHSRNFLGEDSEGQLPSPDISPDMAPILSMLHNYTSTKGLIAISPRNTNYLVPSGLNNSNAKFHLPDPALSSTTTIDNTNEPKMRYFKSRVPENNAIVVSVQRPDHDEKLSDHDASETLLALRKSSIDSLLN